MVNQCKQRGVLCHVGLMRDHGGHLREKTNNKTMECAFMLKRMGCAQGRKKKKNKRKKETKFESTASLEY